MDEAVGRRQHTSSRCKSLNCLCMCIFSLWNLRRASCSLSWSLLRLLCWFTKSAYFWRISCAVVSRKAVNTWMRADDLPRWGSGVQRQNAGSFPFELHSLAFPSYQCQPLCWYRPLLTDALVVVQVLVGVPSTHNVWRSRAERCLL